jgi:RNA polymerase I-specific transcription initiation factor RRN3
MTALSTMPARRRPTLGTSTPPSAQGLPKAPASILGPRSRDAIDDGFDGLESPSKKQKRVAFDLNLNMAIDIGSKSLEQARREVRKALLDLAQGDSSGYDELKEVFGNDTKRYLMPIIGEEEDSLRPEELLVYVVAITNCATLLGKSSSGLIKTILRCAWLGRDDIFVSAYIQLYVLPTLQLCKAIAAFQEPSLTQCTA